MWARHATRQLIPSNKQLPIPSHTQGLQGFKDAPFVSQKPLKALVLDEEHL